MQSIESFTHIISTQQGDSLAKFCRNPSSFEHLQTTFSDASSLFEKALVSTTDTQKCISYLIHRVCTMLRVSPLRKLTGRQKGCGGNYAIKVRGRSPIAIFKPHDEEPFGCNSTANFPRFLGIREGEGAVNECAAFLLDKDHFYGVMPTTLVLLRSAAFFSKSPPKQPLVKIGSLQKWFQQKHLSWEQISDVKKETYAKDQIHKIAILDMRILNLDRRAANLLCAQDTLVPIDHGPTFCASLEPKFNWCWMCAPQAKMKLSPKSLEHIASLNPEEDASLLRQKLGVRRRALFMMRVATECIKIAAQHNLAPFDIGKFIGSLQFTEGSNPLHRVHQEVMEQLKPRYSVQSTDFRPWRDAEQTKAYFTILKQKLETQLKTAD